MHEGAPMEFVLSHPFAHRSGEWMGHGKFPVQLAKAEVRLFRLAERLIEQARIGNSVCGEGGNRLR